jgi:hypothetical protein
LFRRLKRRLLTVEHILSLHADILQPGALAAVLNRTSFDLPRRAQPRIIADCSGKQPCSSMP